MQVSVWEKESFYAPKDVIIVGSGLVGLWCAWHLKRAAPSLNIAILDRGIIPTGASTRNAGFACFGSLSELVYNIATEGEEKTLQLVEMRYKGIERITKVFQGIDFELCGGYELFCDDKWLPHIEPINRLLQPITGAKNTFQLTGNSFALHHIKHLVENKLEGQLHSGKLCQALLTAVQSMGVTILNGIEVKHIENMTVLSNLPMPLCAKQILVCTNAFAKQLLPNAEVVPARGQVLVTSAIDNLKLKGTFHFDEGFIYFRNLGNRVLLGGARNKAFEEETTDNMTITDAIQNELERFLAHYILPGVEYSITDRWSGIMGMGREKMPIVKEVSPNIFCAVRMSGMGVALAPVVGEQIAAMITGG